jgi:hypothetical protein
LYQYIPSKFHNFIHNGQWVQLNNEIKKLSIENKDDIIKNINHLEKIYQFTKKRTPYNSVLNSKDIHYYGEILNTLILIHMTEREAKNTIINFYHKGCLHLSLYKSYNNLIYNSFLNSNHSLNMPIFSNKNKINLLKNFINF